MRKPLVSRESVLSGLKAVRAMGNAPGVTYGDQVLAFAQAAGVSPDAALVAFRSFPAGEEFEDQAFALWCALNEGVVS